MTSGMRTAAGIAGLAVFALASAPQAPARQAPARGRPNVLLIAVDDLRPDLGAYGVRGVRSPNIDRLAARGVVFTRAYCQQAVCSPSRTSLLTGLRPDTTGVYDLVTHFRRKVPAAVTLPEHFRRNGYHTVSVGKVFHGGLDDPQSWSEPSWVPPLQEFTGVQVVPGLEYAAPENVALLREEWEEERAAGRRLKIEPVETDAASGLPVVIAYPKYITGPTWEMPDVPDETLPDGAIAARAVRTLRSLKDRGPFFLAVGIRKPHLPFVAPRKYFDLYPPASAMPLAPNPWPPIGAPRFALHDWGELKAYKGISRDNPAPPAALAREMIRGYRAATSFADAMIGQVLDELDRLGLRESTVVALFGDHGFQLGEHGQWGKHTNFEISTRSPLIVSVPGATRRVTTALVELVDLYPTLVDLAGLPQPAGLEGSSLVPHLEHAGAAGKQAAFSQFPRGQVMGRSIRTDRWRYTEWTDTSKSVVARELYDHHAPEGENANLAARADLRPVMEGLARQLAAGWRGALPPARAK